MKPKNLIKITDLRRCYEIQIKVFNFTWIFLGLFLIRLIKIIVTILINAYLQFKRLLF